jgi:hypothetical protein
MGAVQTSLRKGSEDFASDPATFLAGLAVRRNSSGLLSTTKNDGGWVGISLGKSLSENKNTTVLKAGDMVPVLLSSGAAQGVVTITNYANLVATSNDTLKIGATTFTFKTSASAEDEVLCAASGSSNSAVAAALAAKVNAHSVAKLLFKAVAVGAVVTITALDPYTDGEDIDLVYTDNHATSIGLTVDDVTFTGGADEVVIGSNVYFDDVTGKAGPADETTTVSNAIYMSGYLTGIQEDGSTAPAALISFVGGL